MVAIWSLSPGRPHHVTVTVEFGQEGCPSGPASSPASSDNKIHNVDAHASTGGACRKGRGKALSSVAFKLSLAMLIHAPSLLVCPTAVTAQLESGVQCQCRTRTKPSCVILHAVRSNVPPGSRAMRKSITFYVKGVKHLRSQAIREQLGATCKF